MKRRLSLLICTVAALVLLPSSASPARAVEPLLQWNTFLGGPLYDSGQAVALDASGNIYIAGEAGSTWGSPIRPYEGSYGSFVAKLDRSGTLVWNTFLGGGDGSDLYGLAVDANGNVYVAGTSPGTWGSPVRPFSAGDDAFVAKLSASGGLQWNTFLGGAGADEFDGVALDGSGGIYAAGRSNAAWGSPHGSFAGGNDIVVVKLNSTSGALVWNAFLGSAGNDGAYGIAADKTGSVYVAGYSDATWGSPARGFAGVLDAFVARFDSSGALQWNTFLGGAGSDNGRGIGLDGSGDVYVAGQSGADWGLPVRGYTASTDSFVAKLNGQNGSLVWHTFLGGTSLDQGVCIAVDAAGYSYVAGASDDTWGSPLQTFVGRRAAFVAKLDKEGAMVWNTFLGEDAAFAYGIALDSLADVYVTGDSSVSWGSPIRAFTAGDDDGFVAVLRDPSVLRSRLPLVLR